MASRKMFQFHARHNYIYPASDIPDSTTSSDNQFEFEESDVWNNNVGPSPTESKETIPSSRSSGKKAERDRSAAASLPVSIPDWSKILNRRRDSDDNGDRIPPHEYLARTRGASLSVHEGIGRTLKGRDLRRVRNAIWKKVGFED